MLESIIDIVRRAGELVRSHRVIWNMHFPTGSVDTMRKAIIQEVESTMQI